MSSTTTEEEIEVCGYCFAPIEFPYWKCQVCNHFFVCNDCFLDMNPHPDSGIHRGDHALQMILDPHAADYINEDDEAAEGVSFTGGVSFAEGVSYVEGVSYAEGSSFAEESQETIEEPQVDPVDAPEVHVPLVIIEIVSSENINMPPPENIISDPPAFEDSTPEDSFSSEDDDDPNNPHPFYYRMQK